MGQGLEKNVIRTAEDILQYLEEHTNAMDTLEGIAKWWIPRQRLDESLQTVDKALDYLVERKVICRRITLGGDPVYCKKKVKGRNGSEN